MDGVDPYEGVRFYIVLDKKWQMADVKKKLSASPGFEHVEEHLGDAMPAIENQFSLIESEKKQRCGCGTSALPFSIDLPWR